VIALGARALARQRQGGLFAGRDARRAGAEHDCNALRSELGSQPGNRRANFVERMRKQAIVAAVELRELRWRRRQLAADAPNDRRTACQ
jgi:hypothetical protein